MSEDNLPLDINLSEE
jgi:hypothetical protein